MTLAKLIAICGHFTVSQNGTSFAHPSVRCSYAMQDFICWTRDAHHIADNDPALILFRRRGYPLKDAKIDLAVERANGCDPAPVQP